MTAELNPADDAPEVDVVGMRARWATAPFVAEQAAVFALLDEVERLRAHAEQMDALLDRDVSIRDLEAKIRDGSFTLHVVGAEEGGSPAYRLMAAVCLHLLLGADEELPPNYRTVEWMVRPANEVEQWRIVAEFIRPGGRSSHEIRRDLEAAAVVDDVDEGVPERFVPTRFNTPIVDAVGEGLERTRSMGLLHQVCAALDELRKLPADLRRLAVGLDAEPASSFCGHTDADAAGVVCGDVAIQWVDGVPRCVQHRAPR